MASRPGRLAASVRSISPAFASARCSLPSSSADIRVSAISSAGARPECERFSPLLVLRPARVKFDEPTIALPERSRQAAAAVEQIALGM